MSDRPKRCVAGSCEATRLHLKPTAQQQVELIRHRTWRVFRDDPFVQFVSKRFAAGSDEVIASSAANEWPELREGGFDDIEDPVAEHWGFNASCSFRKTVFHSSSVREMVQHGECEHDDESPHPKVNVANVGLNHFDITRGLGANSLNGTAEHRLAEINQRDIEARYSFQKLQCVVPTAATDIKKFAACRRRDHCCLRHRLMAKV